MADNLGGFGPASTVGDLRDILANLPAGMVLYFEDENGDLHYTRSCRIGVMTEEANANGCEDAPLETQFVVLCKDEIPPRT